MRDSDFNESMYFNVTVGFKAPISGKKKLWYREYNFMQVQFGVQTKAIFIGGGLGVMSSRHDATMKNKMMATLSAGLIFFAEMDMIFDGDKLVSSDLGLLAILPIPVSGFDFGLQ